MTSPSALIRISHAALRRHCRPGDAVLDATMGNGQDTALLAELVGSHGLVLATDKQDLALEKTRSRLRGLGLLAQTRLRAVEHRHMAKTLRENFSPPGGARAELSAAVFNLGYLPGGPDKSLVTDAPSTLAALDAVWPWLGPGALLSVHCYSGHPGAKEEARAVARWMAAIAWNEAQVTACSQHNKAGNPETLYLVMKKE